jgi:hypothetical protein
MSKKFSILITISILAFSFLISGKTIAGTADNVWGWAWSENIGWIKFNSCTDPANPATCGPINYGVNIKADGTFEGYAWSEKIGWITFNESELSGCPSGTCRAWLGSDNNVYGWARALAYGGGWDGWIKLRGSNYGIEIDGDGYFHDWAWGGDDNNNEAVVGWISFNSKNCDPNGDGNPSDGPSECVEPGRDYSTNPIPDYKVMTSLTFIPIPTVSNPTVSFNPCSQSRIPTLSWQTNATMPYDYEIWIDNDPNFGSPEITETVSSTFGTSWAPNCSYCCDISPYNSINFGGNTYYWRVRARNTGGEWSNWSGGSFVTKANCYPYPDFSFTPLHPSVNEVITFSDNSTCWNSSTNPVPCSSLKWDFNAADGIDWDHPDATGASPTTTYPAYQTYTVTLRVTDSCNYSCERSRDISVGLPFPQWREVAP